MAAPKIRKMLMLATVITLVVGIVIGALVVYGLLAWAFMSAWKG